MRFVKNLFMGIGAVALAGMALSLIAPKAVHASVATLVEIVNTSVNPVAISDVVKSAAQNVELLCYGGGTSHPPIA